MANKGRSEKDLFGGGYTHYDSRGKKIGRSEPNFFGGYTNYDAKGHKTGRTEPGFFGGYTTYDNKGRKVGKSEPGFFGSYTNYDSKGRRTGSSDPQIFGTGYNHTDSQGCYIATSVYGSYDCPQVWTLRRFRDYTLAENPFGRAFIKLYYAASPTIVKHFGQHRFFKKFWQAKLDKLVASLQSKGFESTPYKD